jgi:hypothetical protein
MKQRQVCVFLSASGARIAAAYARMLVWALKECGVEVHAPRVDYHLISPIA